MRPWYFKDGTPVNAEQIRRIVKRANLASVVVKETGEANVRQVIREVARQLSRKMERHLIRLLLEEFDSSRRSRIIVPTNDERLDAKRHYRRIYQRQYRLQQRATDMVAA